ncbi:MAG: FG-GAP-like repeat-containing protein [bacterium]|nr:FG-GAP-like repeat-containing protein [bacterium]
MRVIRCIVITILYTLLALNLFAAVPANPSVVSINGRQMRVQHRREDNTLKTETNYVIKGVCWSTASLWPSETYPAGAPFEHDGRRRMWEMAAHDFPRIKEAGFNTIRIYADLGLAKDSSLYFNEDTDGMLWQTDGTGNIIYGEDGFPIALDENSNGFDDWEDGMAMINDLSDNAVTQGLAVLDEAYKNGLKVIFVVDGTNANTALAQKIVTTYKYHPALLMWLIGNEFNYNYNSKNNYMWRYPTFQAACQAANSLASWIKTNDTNHPVAVCLGEPHYPTYEDYKEGVSYLSNIDVIGVNSYRGKSFSSFYDVYNDTVTWNKPVFFSEYGVDAWHYNEDATQEFEDLASQREGIYWEWDDIHAHLSAGNANNLLLGGCAFEWVDEWWKLKAGAPLVHDATPGYPVNEGQPANTYLFPDGCMQEEWWGLNAQDTKNVTPIVFYADCGLIGEANRNQKQAWDIFTWGLPADGTGYGKINSQSDYITSTEAKRLTYSPYAEYTYTGGTGTGNTIPEGNRCMYTEGWSTSYGVGWGLFRTNDTVDVSQYANGNLKFWIKVQKAGNPPTAIGDALKSEFCLKFEDENGPGQAVYIFLDESSIISGFNANSTAWQELTLPIRSLCDGHQYPWLDTSNVKHAADSNHKANMNLARMKMVFSITLPKVVSGNGNTQLWIDNVRWDTGASASYNRVARPIVKDYRMALNSLGYVKTAFEAGATSYTGATAEYARITKDDSVAFSASTLTATGILAAAINPKTGEVLETKMLETDGSVDNWINTYDNTDGDYILSFAKHKSSTFLASSSKLGSIGSTAYNTMSSSDPWVFVVHIVDGNWLAKKESIGTSGLASTALVHPLDYDSDGLYNYADTDSDGDGLTDVLELRYGTDVLNTDTDSDGYGDNTEVTNGTNAKNPDSKVLATDSAAVLQVRPVVLNYSNTELYKNPKDRYLYIENDGGNVINYKVDINYTNGSGWLAVKYRDHSNSENWTNVTTGSYLYDDKDDHILQVCVDTTTLTGTQTYAAAIVITDQNGAGTKTINVSVPIAPELTVSPTNIVLNKPETTKKFFIENSGCGTLSWTISQVNPVNWLSLSSNSGSTTTGLSVITATIDWNQVTSNAYAMVKIDGGNAGVKYVAINVNDVTKYGLDTSLSKVDASIQGLQSSDFRECMALDTGDVNGDGYDDILVGALQYLNATYSGKAYLFLGKKDNWHMDSTIADAIQFVGTEDDNSYYAGTAVAIADVNGDGYKDIIIGDKCAYYEGDATAGFENPAGAIYIFFNKPADGWRSNYALREADVVIRANGYYWHDFGDVMESGDFNNDGYDDLVVGSDNGDSPGAYIIWGRAQNEWNTYLVKNYILADSIPRIDSGTGGGDTYLSDVTRLYNSLRTSATGYNWWEWCDIITVGDFNNDGYDDIVLGNLEYPIGSGTWYRYLVYGKSGKESSWGSAVDVYNDLNVAIPIVASNVASNKINVGWMSAGDVNGDGCYDLLLSTGGTANYLLFGGASKWTAQKTIPADASVTLNLPYKNGSPEKAVWAHIAKDMNGDDIDEVVITGAVFDSGSDPAETYVYLGKSSGWSTVNLATEASASFLAESGSDDSCSTYGWGFLPVTSGDFNGDGFGDLFTVLENNSEATSVAGQAYVIFGKRYMLSSKELLVKDPNENSASFYIKNISIDGQSINWTASENVSWISSISPASGTGLAYNNYTQITVNISRTGLNDGVYTGYVTVTAGGYSEQVKVVLMIGQNPQPTIASITPEHLEISATGTTGTFQISNIGAGSLSWSLAENESWITGLSASSGTLTGTGSVTITVTVDHTGCNSVQTGKITLTYNNGITKDIFVTMKYQCQVKVESSGNSYTSISTAYSNASTSDTLKCQDGSFFEDVDFSGGKITFLEGGYNSAFTSITGKTYLYGTMKISDNSVFLSNGEIVLK